MPPSTSLLLSAFTFASVAFAQAVGSEAGNLTYSSWPHVYPGMPDVDYCPGWQEYFRVTGHLPNVTWPLPRNWAGNIPVQRAGHPNNTLFFWAFESSAGSFTTKNAEPWGIWLNGGPGASSLLGLLFENGPINILSNYSAAENPHSWITIADHVWIDQPVGTGFSTSDADGLVVDEDQLAVDFMGFLGNFIKVFPNLATRPLYIIGESYAGTFIPYITKAYFQMDKPPVNLAGIAIGNGAMSNIQGFAEFTVMSVLETYPQLIGYDVDVFKYFKRQSELCGYNLTLKYPQPEPFPTLNAPIYSHAFNGSESASKYGEKLGKRQFMLDLKDRAYTKLEERDTSWSGRGERARARDIWKRDVSGRPNDTTDPWYLCDLYDLMLQYASNYSRPWTQGLFDFYNIPDALNPEATIDATVFLNDPRTRAAIHAPTVKDWAPFTLTMPFASTNATTNFYKDPSVEPMAFMTELATNATARNVTVIIYSGNDDSLNSHLGSQLVIQNTTFGGIRGFTRKPDTPWYNDHGDFAGIVHQERGWKYILVANAGHVLPYTNPISALTLAREFIFGHKKTGEVTDTRGDDAVKDKETPLDGEILRGQAGIYYGHGATASTYFYPSATVEAWNNYFATATNRN